MLSQSNGNAVYQFALTGSELLQLADISRISRTESGKLIGYQRPEVKKHVQDIVNYLNEGTILFPHAIIIAFNTRVRFVKQRGPKSFDGISHAGELAIPLEPDLDRKPAWIVDGQQRLMAISKSKMKDLPVPVCAFITDNVELQRDQFLRINNAKPLPKGLVEELLPEVSMAISARLATSKIPSTLVNLLNQEKASPFCGMIKRPSLSLEQKKRSVITDGPLIRVIKESLTQPSGCLFAYRDISTGETDIDSIWHILVTFWSAVKEVFPEAWGLPPTKSRLMHSAGLWSIGRLMDRIIPTLSLNSKDLQIQVQKELKTIKGHCHWTEGSWEELGLEWNAVENTNRHVKALSNFLIRVYLREKMGL
ncbi:DGQHR domain-containing protein DpdB [Verrucomicrobia bacterium]|nr:DGQHR domain-containing protein DpdB [Verrucomicrobiota bacterium]